MIAELFAMAVISPQAQPQYGPPIQDQSITRPFETIAEKQLRFNLTIKELEKEKKTNEELKSKETQLKEKIKAESERIKQLKEEIAAKAEADRIAAEQAAEQARLAAEQAAIAQQPAQTYVQNAPAQRPARSSEGNTYAWGNCTWHVKNMRPDIGGFWGNANQWIASAQAAGYPTGSTPRVGAIGVSFAGAYGHVVYVTAVSGDGSTITFSEMNYGGGLGVVNVRSDSAYAYQYIY